MAWPTEGKDAFLRAGFFLITPRAAKGGIKAVFIERLTQGFCLHHLRMECRAGSNGVDAACEAFLIGMHQ